MQLAHLEQQRLVVVYGRRAGSAEAEAGVVGVEAGRRSMSGRESSASGADTVPGRDGYF
jgi:hypothetical protein